jgi:PTH1 family peptidyl-tRNA hydrolase
MAHTVHNLFVGLGNPGPQYQLTYHNVGFIALDIIAHRFKASAWSQAYEGEYCHFVYDGVKIFLLKPMTYMNLSGQSVFKLKQYYKIDINNVFVFHDDVDLPSGVVKIKTGGGCAGHNGLKSIDSLLGNAYHRIRLGIGRPPVVQQVVSDYVLSKINSEYLAQVELQVVNICKNLNFLLAKNFSVLSNIVK